MALVKTALGATVVLLTSASIAFACSLVEEPQVLDRYQQLVDAANEDMDHWSTIKRFKLVADHLSIENGMLTPTLKVKRARLREAYADQIKALYPADEGE